MLLWKSRIHFNALKWDAQKQYAQKQLIYHKNFEHANTDMPLANFLDDRIAQLHVQVWEAEFSELKIYFMQSRLSDRW